MFFLSIIFLALLTICLPLLVRFIPNVIPSIQLSKAPAWLPIAAGVFMVVSTRLPNIHISNQTTTFQQHFVGGGMYSACLYLYAKRLLNWRLYWLLDLITLFAFVSALGVANKLIEFAFLALHLAPIDTADAYWDLLANTLGGFVGYFFFFKFSLEKSEA
jgi:hypothetical protein